MDGDRAAFYGALVVMFAVSWLMAAKQRNKFSYRSPGEIFPLPKGCRLTALDEAIIALPAAILSGTEYVGEAIHCDGDVQIHLPIGPDSGPGARILLRLQAGQSVWLSRSCEVLVVPQSEGDSKPRRLRMSENRQQQSANAADNGDNGPPY